MTSSPQNAKHEQNNHQAENTNFSQTNIEKTGPKSCVSLHITYWVDSICTLALTSASSLVMAGKIKGNWLTIDSAIFGYQFRDVLMLEGEHKNFIRYHYQMQCYQETKLRYTYTHRFNTSAHRKSQRLNFGTVSIPTLHVTKRSPSKGFRVTYWWSYGW